MSRGQLKASRLLRVREGGMGRFIGMWVLVMMFTFPNIGFWISALLNLEITKNLAITKTHGRAMLLALALHALTTVPFAVLLMWGMSYR
jgi:hypothetical protein